MASLIQPLKRNHLKRHKVDYELKPNFLYRLVGEKTTHVVREPRAAYLKSSDGHEEEILSESLANDAGLRRSFIGTKLTLKTPNGKRVMRGLAKKQASDAYADISTLMYETLCAEIQPIANRLRSMITGRYIRSSVFEQAKALAKEAIAKFSTAPEKGLVRQEIRQDFVFIEKVSSFNKNDLEILRARHIENHKMEFKDYFDTVEKNPLTESQRIACITDEDNNLVIAGAGTGKTSTMIGRAGYLVKSGLAQPSEILLLAYGNKAAKELRQRIKERLGSDEVHTFHSLGLNIVSEVEGAKPSISLLVENSSGGNERLVEFVNDRFNEKCKEARYRNLVLRYFSELYYTPPDEFEFKDKGEYYQYLRDNELFTLKGEMVKSYGEVLVANFLFRHGIKYHYEADYEHDTRTPEYRQYQPDFYLPDHGIYIEYFGIARDGSTAPYIDQKKYHEGIEWKRQIHKKHQTCLVEAFYYENKERTLLKNLKRNLENLGVVLRQISQRELLEHLERIDNQGKSIKNKFVKLLAKLLLRIRETGFGIEQLIEKANSSTYPEQMYAAIEIVYPILESYLEELKKNSHIDFDHMIHKAYEYVTNGQYTPNWMFILIDEFQDISKPRAELIKAIKSIGKNCSLFAVGDDWQSIYRFTGSDISFTTQFEKHFGFSKVNFLDTTFRFNNKLSNVASSFVQKNPNQISKQLQTISVSETPTITIIMQTESPGEEDLEPILSHINKHDNSESSVLILSRFKFYLPTKSKLDAISQEYPNLSFYPMTIHASKGKEADYVILVGAVSGTYGLPSMKVTHPLLEELLPKTDHYPHAEERRLFYVALTRTKHRAYIISSFSDTSDFVEEIISGGYEIDRHSFPFNNLDFLHFSTPCPSCLSGKLVPRKTGEFYGCSLYPQCKQTIRACNACNFPTVGYGYERRCVNSDCVSNK